MKTLKLIIAGVAAVILINSCSSDRDEEASKEAIEQVKKTSNKEKFKLNKSGMQAREGEAQATSDTIKVRSLDGQLGDNPDTSVNPDDPEIVPPGDVKPPKGGK